MQPRASARLVLHVSYVFVAAACSKVIGLDELAVKSAAADASALQLECRVTTDCADGADVCRQGACVRVKSSDCPVITGDHRDNSAILIGSLFAFGGAQAGASMARQNSAILAVEEIDGAGGIPRHGSSANPRPLVLVSCDSSADLMRAGKHLIEDLGVPAIIGPNGSQDTLDLSRKLSVPSGTVVITPTALAASIADLLDDGLTWQMVPNDQQRGPLMTLELERLQAELSAARGTQALKLGAVFRADALGIGTRTSLNDLKLNGEPLATAVSRGQARVEAYDLDSPDQQPIVQAFTDFAPDLVVLAGTAEVVQNVMLPLERGWVSDKPRPYYMLIDSMKGAELLEAVASVPDVRLRIRGTGVTPSPRSRRVFDAFALSYQLRYPQSPTDIAGMGPTYDATYAAAFALTAMSDQPVTGAAVAAGLRMLTGGPEVELQVSNVLAAYSHLAMKQPISAIGTFGPLAWGANGAVLGGTLELWCISSAGGRLSFESSGLTLDLARGQLQGAYVQCK